MARGQYLTPHQKGIVKRYYEHKDTLATQKLGEIVSDLFLAEAEGGGKKAEQLWKSARTALLSAGANAVQVERLIERRDLKALGNLAGELF